jgi:LuxR family maltose regulon positive regulatory protein
VAPLLVASGENRVVALALAEPEGYVRVFLDGGEALAALLGRVGCPPWLGQHLPLPSPPPSAPREGGAMISSSPEGRGGQGGKVIEPLSERELEVLRLLAEGLTYAEIAGRLVVSLNTVRFHIKEIYGKLGVNRQAQAVARARELGWL